MNKVAVYDNKGQKAGTVEIQISKLESLAKKAYAVSIRGLLQGWRQGTVGHQTRGQVSLTNRKPWKQKGTGRARAGSARSPLWRGGGVIFGPTPRTRTISIARKQRRLALRSSIQSMLEGNKLYCLDAELPADKPSTKAVKNLLGSLGLGSKKMTVFLPYDNTHAYLSLRNIPNVHVMFFDQPNAFDLTNGQAWVFFKKDLNLFNEMVGAWK